MLRITRPRLLSLILLAALVACTSNDSSNALNGSPSVVTDTLGVHFAVSCSGALCTLKSQDSDATPTSCDGSNGTDTFTFVWSRILTVHVLNLPTAGMIEVNAAEPGHPVACVTDADCYSPGMLDSAGSAATYACQNGLCQATQLCFGGSCDTRLTTNDILTLCQADIPWPKDCPYITLPLFADRIAEVAANCGSNTYCAKVPSDCRQPAALDAVDGGSLDVTGWESSDGIQAALDAVDGGSPDGGI